MVPSGEVLSAPIQALILIQSTIAIPVSLVDYFLDLGIGHSFTKLSSHTFHVLEADLASPISIVQFESLLHLLGLVLLAHFPLHHLDELLEFDLGVAVDVDVCHHL